MKRNVSNEVTVTTTSVGPYNDTYTTDDVTLFKFSENIATIFDIYFSTSKPCFLHTICADVSLIKATAVHDIIFLSS